MTKERKVSMAERQDYEETLREAYPHGHPSFIDVALDQIALHSRKNYGYARGGNPLGNFQRTATILAQYWPEVFGGEQGPHVVAFIYAIKQMDAEGWTLKQGEVSGTEKIEERIGDQAVYANIRLCMVKDSRADGWPHRAGGDILTEEEKELLGEGDI